MQKPKPPTTNPAPSPAPDGPPTPTEAVAPPAPLTPAEVEDLRSKAAKADEHWDRLLRTLADLENYKKRAARERQEAVKSANQSLIEELLPVLDNFDMALAAAANPPDGAANSLQAGVAMIAQQLKTVLSDAGLEAVDAAGGLFDPRLHEAVSMRESSEVGDGQVLQQLRKGYRLHGQLLRPASVIVAKAPAPAAAPVENEAAP